MMVLLNYSLLNDKKAQNGIFSSNHSSYEDALFASVFIC